MVPPPCKRSAQLRTGSTLHQPQRAWIVIGRAGLFNRRPHPPTPYFARSMYSPVPGLTRILSPVATNSGTFTVTPFSSFAGLLDAVFVAVFMTGFVSTIVSVIEFGRRTPIGAPS